MSIIPNCRTDEDYNQKNLNDKDAEFIAGYDWNRIFAVENFFDNIDEYNIEAMEPESEEESALLDYLEEHPEAAEAMKNVLVENIKEAMLHHIEMERDELITSMIDNMDDDEWAKIKEETDEGKRTNCLAEYQFEKEDQENWEE